MGATIYCAAPSCQHRTSGQLHARSSGIAAQSGIPCGTPPGRRCRTFFKHEADRLYQRSCHRAQALEGADAGVVNRVHEVRRSQVHRTAGENLGEKFLRRFITASHSLCRCFGLVTDAASPRSAVGACYDCQRRTSTMPCLTARSAACRCCPFGISLWKRATTAACAHGLLTRVCSRRSLHCERRMSGLCDNSAVMGPLRKKTLARFRFAVPCRSQCE